MEKTQNVTKKDPLMDSPVLVKVVFSRIKEDHTFETVKIVDFKSPLIITFHDFVQKLYLIQTFAEEFRLIYEVSLCNSPSINKLKTDL